MKPIEKLERTTLEQIRHLLPSRQGSECFSQPNPNRRGALARATLGITAGTAVVVAAIINRGGFPDFSSQANDETSESSGTVQKIEQAYRVRVLTLRDAYREHGTPYPEELVDKTSGMRYKDVPDQITDEQATNLKEILGMVPPHFLNASPRRLDIILSTQSSQKEAPRQIQIRYDHLNTDNQDQGLDEVVHELVHDVTPYLGDPIPVQHITGTYSSIRVSEWNNTVNQIFGRDFGLVNREMKNHLIKLYGEMIPLGEKYNMPASLDRKYISDPQDNDNVRFYERLSEIAFYTADPSELVSFMAERYLRGRDNFEGKFSGLFGPTVTKELYEFMKKDVFKGAEI